MHRTTIALLALAAAIPAGAQSVRVVPGRAQAFSLLGSDDPERAMLGVSTSPSGRRDTLGLLVTSVTSGGPADKAGIEEGSRLVSINGVNLRLSRDDAADDDMQGINQNRLTREMRKVKPGENVSLEVYGGGRTRAVQVKTVAASELNPVRKTLATTRTEDRPALGLMLSSTGNKRDTVGVFVQQVVDGGPADKAGIAEGDRIASINGVDVRVPREDVGDWNAATSRIDRLERELHKLTVGQAADLVVVSGGRSRNVKVTTVRSSDLPHTSGFSYRTGDGNGAMFFGPNAMRIMPRVKLNGWNDDGMIDENFRRQIEESLAPLKELGPRIRAQIRGGINDDFRDDLSGDMKLHLEQMKDRMQDLKSTLKDRMVPLKLRTTRIDGL